MMDRFYHCLIAGLPDLFITEGKLIPDLKELMQELRIYLHPDDYRLVTILFLPCDNKNLLNFLYRKEEEYDPLGTFTSEDFTGQAERIDAILEQENLLPGYMVELMRYFYRQEEKPDILEMEKRLTEGYFQAAMEQGNVFLEKWAVFNRDMNNILTAMNSGHDEPESGFGLIGKGEIRDVLEKTLIRGKDFVPPPDPEYALEIYTRADEAGYDTREMEMDRMKWEYIEYLNLFNYFTIEVILGYILRLKISTRWKQLDPGKGKEKLDTLAGRLRDEAQQYMMQ